MEVVGGVRIVQCHAIMNVVNGVRVMDFHAIIDVVIDIRVMLSPSHRFSTFLNFPLRVPILNLLSCCSNSSSHFPVAILCTRFAPRKHVIERCGFLHTSSVTVDPPSAVNDPSVTK